MRGIDFQAFDLRDGVLAAVRFEVADDDVHSRGCSSWASSQHLVGLADAGGVAHEDFQFAARAGPSGMLLREDAHIHAVALPDQFVERTAFEPGQPLALAVSDEDLRDAARRGEIEDAPRRVVAFQNFDVAPAALAMASRASSAA